MTVSASVTVRASLAEVWDHYFEPQGWPTWVDQFQAVVGSEGYPDPGGTLRWRSVAAGRGEVVERVLEHEPRRLHRIAWADPVSEGELTTRFEIRGEATRVSQSLDYRVRDGGIFSRISDLLFVRTQMRGSLERSLARLRHEVEELAALGRITGGA
jgi:uncharacterized membrane protein